MLMRFCLAALLVLAALAISIFVASLPLPCNTNYNGADNSQASQQQPKKDCPSAISAIFIPVGGFIHEYREEIVAVGTLFIAVFTIVLAFATGFLYFATRDLVQGAKSVSETQLRAFIFAKSINAKPSHQRNPDGSPFIDFWVFWSDLENVGLTPATDVKVWIAYKEISTETNVEPHFDWNQIGSSAVMGPRAIGKTGFCLIPIKSMIALWERRIEIYVATRIEYRDVFTPTVIHYHEQCGMLDLLRHPADVEDAAAESKNLNRVTIRVYGPQNGVS